MVGDCRVLCLSVINASLNISLGLIYKRYTEYRDVLRVGGERKRMLYVCVCFRDACCGMSLCIKCLAKYVPRSLL